VENDKILHSRLCIIDILFCQYKCITISERLVGLVPKMAISELLKGFESKT